MSELSAEEKVVAERAAEWVERLKKPLSREERSEFVRWLRQSSLHVREMLLALTWDRELDDIDPGRRIDLDDIVKKASVNVVSVWPEITGEHPRLLRWARWPWITSFSAVTATAVVLVMAWSDAVNFF